MKTCAGEGEFKKSSVYFQVHWTGDCSRLEESGYVFRMVGIITLPSNPLGAGGSLRFR